MGACCGKHNSEAGEIVNNDLDLYKSKEQQLVKIQASIRGYNARTQVKKLKASRPVKSMADLRSKMEPLGDNVIVKVIYKERRFPFHITTLPFEF
jgi:hypothetical protein